MIRSLKDYLAEESGQDATHAQLREGIAKLTGVTRQAVLYWLTEKQPVEVETQGHRITRITRNKVLYESRPSTQGKSDE